MSPCGIKALMHNRREFLRIRDVLHSNCLGVMFLLALTACHAQTLSRCHPTPPMPPNVKPSVSGLSLSRDGKTIVVAGADARIRLVDMTTGKVRRTLTGHANAIYEAIFSPDEKLLASSSRDLTARIWDVSTAGKCTNLTAFVARLRRWPSVPTASWSRPPAMRAC